MKVSHYDRLSIIQQAAAAVDSDDVMRGPKFVSISDL